jgi:hypothetical protein
MPDPARVRVSWASSHHRRISTLTAGPRLAEPSKRQEGMAEACSSPASPVLEPRHQPVEAPATQPADAQHADAKTHGGPVALYRLGLDIGPGAARRDCLVLVLRLAAPPDFSHVYTYRPARQPHSADRQPLGARPGAHAQVRRSSKCCVRDTSTDSSTNSTHSTCQEGSLPWHLLASREGLRCPRRPAW